ncbi:MAG TPA: hypothetical protein VKA21_15500 [Candidatus Binatia bacterium]|nr:hypothetical protein [Candidatus Binatia bacterium]
MKRLELAGIRVCERCGRGTASLRSPDGGTLSVRLDPIRARELAGPARENELRTLTDVVLEQLVARGARPSEVVLDVLDGRLGGLVSLAVDGEAEGEVVTCTAEEGLALALRGTVPLYATDEALAARAARPAPDTIH